MTLWIGRLALSEPDSFAEPVGDNVSRIGSTPVPTARTGIQVSAGLESWPDSDSATAAQRQRVRRALRSLIQNRPMCLNSVYVQYTDDPDLSGWYVPGGATFDVNGPGGLYSSYWKFSGVELGLIGRRRTHRPAVVASLRSITGSADTKDYLKHFYGGSSFALTKLALTWLPSTPTDVTITQPTTAAMTGPRAGQGTAMLQAVVGTTDLQVITFEQDESAQRRGDVVVYDRRGTMAGGSTGPGTGWEEVYGPDFPLAANDVPVIENSLVRVRWDTVLGTGGFEVDVWDGAAWNEQGKVLIERRGDTNGFCDTLVRADVMEWAPERAVIRAVLKRAADPYSREEVYITLQRGWMGPRFEVYPAPKSTGALGGAGIAHFSALADTNTAVIKPDATPVSFGTAGSGSAVFSATYATGSTTGAATWTGENAATVMRIGATFGYHLAVVHADTVLWRAGGSDAYASPRNAVAIQRDTFGYVSAQIGYFLQATDASMEAESMTLSAGTTTGADAGASGSGNNSTQATRTATAAHVTKSAWLPSDLGTYRVFARVRNAAAGTLNVSASTTATTGATKTTTSTTYVWLDLGDIVIDGSTLTIRAWRSSAGTLWVDRIDAIRVEDRASLSAPYTGARDLGRSILYDSRSQPTVISR